jgi:subfamily B ATP-binding cassette protein MsbA
MKQPAAPAAGMRDLWQLARPYRWIALLAFIGMAIEAGAGGVFVRLIDWMLDDVFGSRDPAVIAWLPWAIVGLFAMRGMGVFVGDYGASWISRKVIFDLRERCFAHYLRLPSSYYARSSTGELLAQLTNYSEEVGKASTDGFKILLVDGMTVLVLVTMMFLYSTQLTLFVLLIGPLIGTVVSQVGKRYRRVSRRIQGSLADVNHVAQQVLTGERDVKIYGASAVEQARFGGINQFNLRQNLKITATSAVSTSIVQFLAAAALALVVWLASRGYGGKQMEPGDFMAYITAMLGILPSLKRLTTVQALLQRGLTALGSIQRVLAEPQEVDNGTHSSTRALGALRFEGVGVRYPGAEADALTDINLDIPAGSTVALVGRSGGGKSTLAALLPRFLNPDQGRITLDGVDLRDWTLQSLRQQIALVSQHVVLFNDSVHNNIAFGSMRTAATEQVQAAAAAAQASGWIDELPQGLQTSVGENGALLSGGQRQRVAIARALLKDAPVLILDEATSALDNESERLIQQAFDALRRDRTVLVIAHRLSTVERADRIVVLDRGRIVESGTHAELLAAGGLYRQLYQQDEFSAGRPHAGAD